MASKWAREPVEWIDGDTAFISVVFTWHLEHAWSRARWLHNAGYKIKVGGPGTWVRTPVKDDLKEFAEVGGHIEDAVARHNPDATFASRGCPVGCWFCIVPSMEGRTFTMLEDFPVRPILCDNNLSALPGEYQDHIVKRYRETGVPLLDANSGFEPRTFDEDVFHRWKGVLKGPWRFALDDMGDYPHVERVLDMLKDVPASRKRVYTLIGNEPFDECMSRIRMVIDKGGQPYAQPLLKLNAPQREPWVRHDWTAQKLKRVARWVNRYIWRKTPFEDYRRSSLKQSSIPSDGVADSLFLLSR